MDVDAIGYKPYIDLEEIFAVVTRDAMAKIAESEPDIMAIVRSLGWNGHRYRRERQRAFHLCVRSTFRHALRPLSSSNQNYS